MVDELNIGGSNLTNSKDIAEGFNDFFSNVGPHLASKIDTSNCNFQEHIKNIESEFTAFEAVTTVLTNFIISCVAFLALKPLALTKFLVKSSRLLHLSSQVH